MEVVGDDRAYEHPGELGKLGEVVWGQFIDLGSPENVPRYFVAATLGLIQDRAPAAVHALTEFSYPHRPLMVSGDAVERTDVLWCFAIR